MRELFVDTNVLIGLCVRSDRWYREAQPVYDNDHDIHTSELVVYEFCSSPNRFTYPPGSPEDFEADWRKQLGVFKKVSSRLKMPYTEYRRTIRALSDDDLTLDKAIEEFIEVFEIRPEAEPQVRSDFKQEFEDKAVTRQYINSFVSSYIIDIIKAAHERKSELADVVTVHDSRYHEALEDKRRWRQFPENPPSEPDLSIVTDATQVTRENSVGTVLTGDADLLTLQKIAQEYFEFDILSMADEYSVERM